MRLKELLTKSISSNICLIALGLTGCGTHLKPEVCVSSPKTQSFQCHDYRTAKDSTKTLTDVDEWACLSPIDFQDTLEACKREIAGPRVNACIVDAPRLSLSCYDLELNLFNEINFADSEGYVCLSPLDDKEFLAYCKTIQTSKFNRKRLVNISPALD